MFRLSNLADYAVLLTTQIAARSGSLHSVQALSVATGLGQPTVAKVLGALARNGVLVSQRGAHGGFRLARTSDEITIVHIVEAVDGPIALTNCLDDDSHDCSIESFCTNRQYWVVINDAIRKALSDVTLAEISGAMAPGAVAEAFERAVRAGDSVEPGQ